MGSQKSKNTEHFHEFVAQGIPVLYAAVPETEALSARRREEESIEVKSHQTNKVERRVQFQRLDCIFDPSEAREIVRIVFLSGVAEREASKNNRKVRKKGITVFSR